MLIITEQGDAYDECAVKTGMWTKNDDCRGLVARSHDDDEDNDDYDDDYRGLAWSRKWRDLTPKV